MSPKRPKKARARLALRIRRQESPAALPQWSSFRVTPVARMTIAEALDLVALAPVTVAGERTAAVAYTWGCTGPGCGSCTVLAQGRPVPACATLLSEVAPKRGALVLEPLAKLGVVRDLLVDRSRLRAAAESLRAWLPAAPPDEPDADPAVPPGYADPALALALSRCSRCGACIEACPEARASGGFLGAAAIAQSRLVDLHAASDAGRAARHAALSHPGGIHECGQAQNCLEVCPEALPLDDVLATAARDAAGAFWRTLFRRT